MAPIKEKFKFMVASTNFFTPHWSFAFYGIAFTAYAESGNNYTRLCTQT
jgi:hypothetical protein